MPRPIRLAPGDLCYHVINRGNARATVFHKEDDYAAFLRLISLACERVSMRLLAWCLMPNHFHLAVWPRGDGDLSRWMQWLTTSHVRRYHRHYKGSGHVWQGRYKAFVSQSSWHLLTVLRYVERNPVRAGLVGKAQDWRFSSAALAGSGKFAREGSGSFSRIENGGRGDTGPGIDSDRGREQDCEKVPDPFILNGSSDSTGSGTFLGILPPKKEPDPSADTLADPLPIAAWLYEGPVPRPSPWLHFVNRPEIEAELLRLRESANRGTPFGDPDWQKQTGAELGQESTLRPRGRPRKEA